MKILIVVIYVICFCLFIGLSVYLVMQFRRGKLAKDTVNTITGIILTVVITIVAAPVIGYLEDSINRPAPSTPTPTLAAASPTITPAVSISPTASSIAAATTPTDTPTPTPRPPTMTPIPPPPTAPPAAAVRWSGEFLLPGQVGAPGRDLDRTPPADAGDADENDFAANQVNYTSGQIALSERTNVAPWTGASAPTAAQCADALARFGLGPFYKFLGVERRLAFCLRTSEGRVAFATVEEVRPKPEGYLLTATVWELTNR